MPTMFDSSRGNNRRGSVPLTQEVHDAFLRLSYQRILITFLLLLGLVGVTIFVAERVELTDSNLLNLDDFNKKAASGAVCNSMGSCNLFTTNVVTPMEKDFIQFIPSIYTSSI